MSVEITVAVIIWFAVTLSAPAKLRIFFALLSGSLIALLLTFSILSPKKEILIHIPSSDGKPGYKIPFKEFKALTQTEPDPTSLMIIPEVDSLKSANKQIYTSKDLTAKQLKSLEKQADFIAFTQGKKGLVIRNVKASIQDGKVVPAYDAVEFSNLPLLDDLDSTKQKLNKTQQNLDRKQKVLEAIRDIVDEPQKSGS